MNKTPNKWVLPSSSSWARAINEHIWLSLDRDSLCPYEEGDQSYHLNMKDSKKKSWPNCDHLWACCVKAGTSYPPSKKDSLKVQSWFLNGTYSAKKKHMERKMKLKWKYLE